MANEDNYKIKVLLVGSSRAGKTAIGEGYALGQFEEHPYPWIGVDFWKKWLTVWTKTVKLFVWDSFGAAKWLPQSYFRGCSAIIFVYDSTSAESFHELDDCVKAALRNLNKEIPFVLVATKLDLKPRAVKREVAEAFARKHNMMHIETSSKEDMNIKEIFSILIPYLVLAMVP
mmetsp:Transcript_56022/g.63931  ORF Transcript_56022/g.63931 Transcript_56022/m.63931 type:complete len:173 (-) Transcript_56022:19-537(-)